MTMIQKLSRFLFVSIAAMLLSISGNAQQNPLVAQAQHVNDHDHGNDLAFIKNKGQWHENVIYKARLGGLNTLFMEEKGFTYLFHEEKASAGLHDHHQMNKSKEPYLIPAHAYRVKFLNALSTPIQGLDKRTEYHNYFLGNDSNKWASNVGLYNKVVYPELYPGISLEAYDVDGFFKYDFIVQVGANHQQIQMAYEGADRLEIVKNKLVIHTTVGEINEYEPYAYQESNGKKNEVNCQYVLTGNIISFHFPNGYDPNLPVVIDPTVVAATLTGTIGEQNFGHTATFDNAGNIYVGAASFGIGYPTTNGALQPNYGGGVTDIAINKYNQTGSGLVYSTYIGGNNAENPHSLITDFDQQLYVYGTSSSANYPTSNNAFQKGYGGSTDIVITILNSTGTSIVGSTFVGGSSNDGNNTWEFSTNTSGMVRENYGDYYRGEIVLDGQRNVYIASVTSSNQFPVTANAFDTSFNPTGNSQGPAQDGVVFKMNSDLSQMHWATFLGGDQTDTANGLRVDDFGNVFVVGGAGASNFPVTTGTVQSNWSGGIRDAYVVKLAPDGQSMLRGTFWGSSGNEKGFFIDIDEDDNIHILGQTTGNMPITPNTYFKNANSHQFITAFDKNLNSVIYSTVIGTGSNPAGTFWAPEFDFIPVAFMVDKCNNIYFSGYGAVNNLPTTPDALISNTLSELFYLGVLDPLAAGLSYGTYYGESNHVDGGTSRFDKSGTVYQGVCSCLGTVMNTQPNAWATTQQTDKNCDAGVFKIDFDVATVTALATAIPSTSGCAPFDVELRYTGKDATVFQWDLGNGTTSTQANPVTTYNEAGTYQVLLVASNNATCNAIDSFFMTISVFDGSSTLLDTTICNNNASLPINVTTTNATYKWNDGLTSSSRNITESDTYWVEITLGGSSGGGCSRLDSFVVNFADPVTIDLGPDFSICDQVSTPFDATTPNISYYEWEDGSNDPMRTLTTAGTYSIFVIDENGCTDQDEVVVQFGETPFVSLGMDDTLCAGTIHMLDAVTPDVDYLWSNGTTEPTLSIAEPGTYWVEISNNGCPYRDSITINYTDFNLTFDQSDVLCDGDCNGFSMASISGSTAPYTYLWDNGSSNNSIDDLCPGDYFLTVTDAFNCVYENTIVIGEPDELEFNAEITDVECANDGDGVINISTTGGIGPYLFALNDTIYQNDNAFDQLSGGDYEVFVQDANGCITSQTLNIYEPPFVSVDAGPDRTIELGESTRLNGIVLPYFGQLIQWMPTDSLESPSDLITIAQPTSTTLYNLVVTDTTSGCVISDDVLVRVDKVRDIYIPNAFSPNADGINDLFYVYAGAGVRIVRKFKIFDRWGELIFEGINFHPNSFKHGWDGTFLEQPMNSGVFVYLAEVEFIDDEVILYKGDITLLR